MMIVNDATQSADQRKARQLASILFKNTLHLNTFVSTIDCELTDFVGKHHPRDAKQRLVQNRA
jgi:hypothetical protein